MRMLASVAMLATVLTAHGASAASAASAENGRRLVQRNCAVCHAIGTTGQSPHKGAPPFRELHDRYPVEMLAEALAEGMLTGHPAMPQFTFTPRQIDDIIAYLESVQTPRGRI
jgi:mono/diheme cytochrome c family protein